MSGRPGDIVERMKRFLPYLFTLLLVAVPPVYAKDVTAPDMSGATTAKADPNYFDPTTIDPKTLLPVPPADGSPETLKEIDVILEKQKSRTPAEVARASSEVKLDVFAFTAVVGPWFTAKNVPGLAAFFQKINDNAHAVTDAAKKDWARPRPYLQDKRIQPAVALEKSDSYPSGHATRGMVFALVLANLVPDKKDAILARGAQIGDDRVLAGVHFPSDIAAGQTLAKAIFDKLLASEAFQEDLVVAKTAITAASAKK